MNEESWVITGVRFGGLWCGWRRWRSEGEPHQVGFPWKRVLKRQRFQGDVVGFYHTHPGMSAVPSSTDVATMRAWSATFGKPLLCVIAGSDGTHGYVFFDDECSGVQLMRVYSLGWGIVLGVEHGRAKEPLSSGGRS